MIWLPPKKQVALPSRQRGFLLNPHRFGPVPDPLFASVKSLLHFDGSNGSTTFTDQKGITWTPSGNAQISTAQSLYGGASGLFDGNNDYLSGSDASLALGSGDFCMEGACRKAGNGAAGNTADLTILDFRASEPSAQVAVIFSGSASGATTQNAIYLYVNGAVRIVTATLSNNTWYQWAVERVSGVTKLYLNGTAQATTYTDGNNYTATAAVIGGRFAAVSGDRRSFNGYLDEMRATVGAYRYNGNYTPSGPFPNS